MSWIKRTLEKGKEAIVMELLREGKISQGKAAELLEISRGDLFDLMAKHDIPMADFPPEELKRQVEYAEKKERNSIPEVVVADSSPLISFARANKLHIIPSIYKK